MILVTWRDAHFELDEEPEVADYIVQTLGWEISQGARFMTIASEKLPNGDGYRAYTTIPLSSVEHVENLKVG